MEKTLKDKWFIFKSTWSNIKRFFSYFIAKPLIYLLNIILNILGWFFDHLPEILGWIFGGGFCLLLLLLIVFGIKGCYDDNKTIKENNLQKIEIVYYTNENGDKCVYTNFYAECRSIYNIEKRMVMIFKEREDGIKSDLTENKFDECLAIPNFVLVTKWIKKDESK